MLVRPSGSGVSTYWSPVFSLKLYCVLWHVVFELGLKNILRISCTVYIEPGGDVRMHNLTTTLNADTGTSISLPFTTHDSIYQVSLYYPQHLVIPYSLCCGKRRLFAYISNGSGPHQKARPKILTDPRKKNDRSPDHPNNPSERLQLWDFDFFSTGYLSHFHF